MQIICEFYLYFTSYTLCWFSLTQERRKKNERRKRKPFWRTSKHFCVLLQFYIYYNVTWVYNNVFLCIYIAPDIHVSIYDLLSVITTGLFGSLGSIIHQRFLREGFYENYRYWYLSSRASYLVDFTTFFFLFLGVYISW